MKDTLYVTYLALMFFFSILSCKKEDDIPDDNILAIGQSYEGGIIAYLDGSGSHGLIAAPSDQSGSIYWHETADGLTGATGTSIGTGSANTNAIIALYGSEVNAARICYDLIIGSYDDWYLPSKDELNQLYVNRQIIGGFSSATMDGSTYWTSTETSDAFALRQNFFNGDQEFGYNKETLYRVRAVRSF